MGIKSGIITALFISTLCVNTSQGQSKSLENVQKISELQAYSGTANSLVVVDKNNSATFLHSDAKLTEDGGVIIKAARGGYWVRQYQPSNGVELSWFGALSDSVTNDVEPLKKALAYDLVNISGNVLIGENLTIPQGKQINFTNKGSIVVKEGVTVQFNGVVKASEYQHIFKGEGKVVLGATSTTQASVCWYGARPDCNSFTSGNGTDNTTFIQKAIDNAYKVSDIYLPPVEANKSYRITSTIQIRKTLHFYSLKFHGGGNSITYSADDRASNIFADFTSGAAINIQGSRRCYISDFALVGLNIKPKRLAAYDTITITSTVSKPENFLSPDLSLDYTAITTDGIKDNKVFSADIVFERLQIERFGIGIGISQAGNVQGDRMRVKECQINFCVYGISVGQAQNRACHFQDVDMNRNWCAITNRAFGDHTGSNFQVTGGQWCNIYKCFDVQPSYMGQCVVSGLYTEAIGYIGDIGTFGPNNSSMLFTGCEFFMQDDGLGRGYAFTPPFYTLVSYGNVTFEGCNFWTGRKYLAMFSGSSHPGFVGSSVNLLGCSLLKATMLHIHGNATIEHTYFNPNSHTIDYNNTIMVDFTKPKRINTGFNAHKAVTDVEYINGNSKKMTSEKLIIRKVPRFYMSADGRAISDFKYSKDTLEFSFSEKLENDFFKYVLPGDILGTEVGINEGVLTDNPTMQVINIDHNLHKATVWAHTKTFITKHIALYSNSFFATVPIEGNITSGTNEIKNTENFAMLQVGDFITFKEATRVYRIKNIDTTSGTLTLFDNISDQFNGRTELYNQVLIDQSPEQTSKQNAAIIKTTNIDLTLTETDNTVLVNTAANNITIQLPGGAVAGQTFIIKKIAAQNSVTIQHAGGTIDGEPKLVITENMKAITVQYDGSNYFVISK